MKRYDTALNDDETRLRWEQPKREVGLTDSKKRQHIAQWASEAWDEFCCENQYCIKRAFIGTGFLVAKDGSENHLIELWQRAKGEWQSVGPHGETYDFN